MGEGSRETGREEGGLGRERIIEKGDLKKVGGGTARPLQTAPNSSRNP